jgi:hypothetical protein
MTGSGTAGGAVGVDEADAADGRASGPGRSERRAAPERRREWFWARGFPVLTVALALAVPTLLVTGRSVVLRSTAGAVEHQVTDPSAPGWQAFTEPTPVALVLQRGSGGALAAVTLLSLTGEGTGAVVFVPVDTVVPGTDPGRTLAEIAADGEAALRSAVETLLGLSPSDVVALDATGWREAVGTGPVTIESPDAVFAPDAEHNPVLRFPRGSVTLTAGDVADYLALRNFGERDLNRLVRHEVFWRAWLQVLGRSPAGTPAASAAPGVLARYVGALAAGRVDLSTLPVQVVAGDGPLAPDRFVPVAPRARDTLARVVPFPIGGPRARLRIRLLDGVGRLHHGLDAAAGLVARGGQIDQVGNAPSFGVARTRLGYGDDAHRREVEALAQELGVGEVVKDPGIEDGTDVVVTLGQDYMDARATGRGGTGG